MNTAQVRLIRPTMQYADTFTSAIKEFQAEGRAEDFNLRDVEGEIERLLRKRFDPLPNRVRESIFWLMDGDEYVGDFKLRHDLSSFLKVFGGHIGYQVRPSQRRRGYGTIGLRLLLEEARKLGLERVMLTCDTKNIGSRRIIESNGGILECERRVEFHAEPFLVWWIDLKQPA